MNTPSVVPIIVWGVLTFIFNDVVSAAPPLLEPIEVQGHLR